MQKHIEWIDRMWDSAIKAGRDTLDLELAKIHAKSMLEKERKVIEDAFENGQNRGLHNGGGLLGEFYYDEAFIEEGKSYGLVLNETFNTKEK